MKFIYSFFILLIISIKVNSQNKPEVFIVSIGISKYQNPKYNLQFAHKDALDLELALKKQTDLFDIRKTVVLTDEKATRSNVRNELTGLKKLISPNDLFILIFSGHGLNESLVTYDFNMSDRTATTLQKSDLVELISQFNCNYLMLIDACHSGSFAKGIDLTGKDIGYDFVEEQNIANEKLLRALNATDKANIVIGSSSSSEKSDECQACQNGYFTQAILDAFEGKSVIDPSTKKEYFSDRDKNGFIYTNELDDYLKEAVSIRTRNNAINQSVISKQSPGFNFPIFKLLDSDGDGTADIYDQCQGLKGTAMGCPDIDKDGIADKADRCPNEFGVEKNLGCPETNIPNKLSVSSNSGSALVKHSSKMSNLSKSIILPGWSDKKINPDSKRTLLGGIGYGLISTGLIFNTLSNQSYKKYQNSNIASEVLNLRNKSINQSKTGKIFLGMAAAVWVFEIGHVTFSNKKSYFTFNEGLTLNLKF